jgi:glycosyltransferase involved in cell wall biosynthesis
MRAFHPDIIHYVTAPTMASLCVLSAARTVVSRRAKLVVSAIHPNGFDILHNPIKRLLIPFVRPDICLTQSLPFDAGLRSRGFRTVLFPNGIDLEKFSPAPQGAKTELRARYGIDPSKFVVLHVGHIRENRGLRILCTIAREMPDVQVVIVGSTHFKTDQHLLDDLRRSGCLVLNQYFPHIEEVYQMADCYLFPKGATIFLPLSVLEAMACNIPVISHSFDGLSAFFTPGDGLCIAENEDGIKEALRYVTVTDRHVNTRGKVLPYSWVHMCEQLLEIYSSL